MNRYGRGAGIVDDLREAVELFGEHDVIAMNEYNDSALSRGAVRQFPDRRFGERLLAAEITGYARHEISSKIARLRSRPFDMTLDVGRRHADRRRREIESARPFAAE